MKLNKTKRREYYVHQIVRDDENNDNQQEKVNSSKISTVYTKTKYNMDDIGCRRDPSVYDYLRASKTKNDTTIKKEIVNEQITINDNGNTKNDIDDNVSLDMKNKKVISDDDYYASIADEIVQDDEETIMNDIISFDELSTAIKNDEKVEVVKEQVVEPKVNVVQERVVEPKPVINNTSVINQTVSKPRKITKYVPPKSEFLNHGNEENNEEIKEFAEKQKEVINNVLKESNIKAFVDSYVFGPTVIQYLIKFEKINEKVESLRRIENNLAMYLECENIRIQTPIPGMRFAGIEIPRPAGKRGTVYLGDIIDSKEFKNSKYALPIAVGKDNFGKNVIIDIADMPHGLVAGATKSGKSVALNSFILSLIYHYTPDDVRLILIDPKMLEFGTYADIPHLATPVIIDQEYFEPVTVWLTEEMERRCKILNTYGCKELGELNETLVAQKQPKIPYLVMIMDEFNDWFANASNTIDTCITRLAQKARAAGIDIILATQRPSADVIRGAIKANFVTRFAFRVSSSADSNVILGQGGAEKLEGRGDVILRHTGMSDTRLQAAYVSNAEIKAVVKYLKENNTVDYIVTTEELKQSIASRGSGNGSADPHGGRNDELFKEVAYYVVRNQNASVNQMQKIFGTGFNRMNDIFRDMENLGILSKGAQGAKREVLVDEFALEEILSNI